MLNINQRIQSIVDELFNGNVSEFERTSGIKPSTVKNIVGSRQTKPSYDILESIIRNNVQVSSEWLLTGQGSMLKSPLSSSSQHIQNRDGIVAGGSMIVPSHYAAQKKEEKLAQIKAELSEIKRENKRVDDELCKAKKEVGVLRDAIEALTKENAELHKQLIKEKERLISMLMEKKQGV